MLYQTCRHPGGWSQRIGEGWIGLAGVFLLGLVLCLSVWRTGTLWWAIGFHAAWDWVQSFVLGVADSGVEIKGYLMASHPVGSAWLSGAATGPEGSVLIVASMAIAAGAALVTLRKRDFAIAQQA